MRKVTEQTVKAFLKGESKTVGNTKTDGKHLWLHGNLIAWKVEHDNNEVGIIGWTLAGWGTPTTRERLNGIFELIGSSVRLVQRQHCQKLWDGVTGKETPVGVRDQHAIERFDV